MSIGGVLWDTRRGAAGSSKGFYLTSTPKGSEKDEHDNLTREKPCSNTVTGGGGGGEHSLGLRRAGKT